MLFTKLLPPRRELLIGLLVVLGCTAYAALTLERGWIPHDEGQLGHTAERILAGQLPHRDFVEPYTGGLGYLDAAAFWLLGVRCESLRWAMLPFFAGFVACVYVIARRAASPGVSALVTFLCVCLTLPVYPAGMPSWYNLFFATYAAAALLRHVDTGQSRWLVAAGICGGLSVLVKITGLYLIAAGVLFLVYREQLQNTVSDRRSLGYAIFATAMLAAFAALGLLFLKSENPAMNVVHFLLPWSALAGWAVWHEWRHGRGASAVRFLRGARLVLPFAAGAGGVLLIWVALYAATGALSELYHGLFVLPQARLAHARMPLPDSQWLLMALPYALLLGAGFRCSSALGRWWLAALLAALVGLFAISHTDRGHVAIFQGLRHQLPIVVSAAVATLIWATRHDRLSAVRRQELFLLAAVTLLVSLVQYPYAGGFYFFYAAPLGVLTALLVVRSQATALQPLHYGVLCFVTLFLVLRMHMPGPAITGGPYRPGMAVERLGLERGNLLVARDDAHLYRRLVTAVQTHSAPGSAIYAAPDCPEVYFLSARSNATKTLYDFFDGDRSQRAREMLRQIDRHDITVAVIKLDSEFSANLSSDLWEALAQRFDHQQSFHTGMGAARRERFRLHWRASEDSPRTENREVSAATAGM